MTLSIHAECVWVLPILSFSGRLAAPSYELTSRGDSTVYIATTLEIEVSLGSRYLGNNITMFFRYTLSIGMLALGFIPSVRYTRIVLYGGEARGKRNCTTHGD